MSQRGAQRLAVLGDTRKMARPGPRRLAVIGGAVATALVITSGAPASAAEDNSLVDAPPTTSAAISAESVQRPFVVGLAQVAKGYPIRHGRVLVENLRGKRLAIRRHHHRGLRYTQKTGAFALPKQGLPRRFVVVVRGGKIHGRATKGTFRAVVTRSVRRGVAQVSMGTTVQTSLYRSMRGKRSFSARVLRKAHNRILRTVRLPRYLTLGWDDRVNPRFIRGKRLQKYAKELGGYRALARRVERAARRHKTIPLASPAGRTARVASADVVEDCADATFDFTPKALAECVASGALAVVSSAFGPSPTTQVVQALQDVNTDLADLSQQLSSLQADLNSDFLDLVAEDAQDEYNAAARELLPITSGIQAQLVSLSRVAANVPGQASSVVVNQQVTALVGQLNPDTPASVLSDTTATELAEGTVSNGAGGLGTLPAAWQAVRAEQLTGTMGATVSGGDAALGQGTTLFTNEMSAAFESPSDYWYNQLQLLGVLTANYYNYLYSQDGLTPSQVVAETADVIGGFSASGTCPGTPAPGPLADVACPGSISYNLMEQAITTPLTVPPGTVVDPTTDLVWGTALSEGVVGSSSGSGLPNDPATGNSLVPELLNQVQAGASSPWAGVNPNLLALSSVTGVQDWNLPEINFATGGSNDFSPYMPEAAWPYNAGASPQLGSQSSGSGLLGGVSSAADLGDLPGLTDPPAFPADVAMWSQSNLWSYVDSYWNGQQRCWNDPNGHAGTYCNGPFGGLPAGAVQFGEALDQCGQPFPDLPVDAWGASSVGPCPSASDAQVSAPVVLNAAIPGEYYAYPAAYPKDLLVDWKELAYQISLFR